MPAAVAAVLLVAIYVVVKAYWIWLLAAVLIFAAIILWSSMYLKLDTRKAERREAQRLGDLRNEPLSDGESIEERIARRYLDACGSYVNEIAGLHYLGGTQWRDRLGEVARQYLRPVLSSEQWDAARAMLLTNQRQNLITFFERPIIDKSQEARGNMARYQQADAARLRASYNRPDMDGIGFEIWCVDVLRSNGWVAEPTKASGDQGADVIAKKGGKTVAVQCKFYTGAVGNKAVQEIHAAKTYYGADYGIVVAKTRGYTLGATDLAGKVGVKLLAAEDLYQLERHL